MNFEPLVPGTRLGHDETSCPLGRGGMGGAATLPLIRNLRPELPVVIATGRLLQEAVGLTRSWPLVSLMPKPYGLRELRRRLA